MVIPWYLLWDKWERDAYIKECVSMNQDIIDATKWKITAIWWNVSIDETKKNQDWRVRKYNSVFIASNWELVSNWVMNWVMHKTLLPNYRLFDDKRYFTWALQYAKENNIDLQDLFKPFEVIIDWVKTKISLLICEDIWNINNDYDIDPLELTMLHKPDILAVSSASPFGLNKKNMRQRVLTNASQNTELIYVNPVWIQNNGKNVYTFEWGSCVYKNWVETFWVKDYTSDIINIIENNNEKQNFGDYEQIYNTMIYAIKEFFISIKQTKVVIWLSWGLDSAVVAALCTKALWKENVIAVNMPSKFNSKTTKSLASDCAARLGIEYRIVWIQESVEHTINQLNNSSTKEVSDFVTENIQARDRWSRVLAWIAAQENAVFTNNWNKSEIALWYATLYWDVNWVLAVIWDLYKSQVFELARYINKVDWNVIPTWIIDIKPSAELSAKQDVDKWEWDPFNYEFLDKVLYQYIELRKMPEDLLQYYIDWKLEEILWLDNKLEYYYKNISDFVADIEKYFRLMEINFFKRVQCPPIIALSKRPFGYDLRESQDIPYFETRNYKILKKEVL